MSYQIRKKLDDILIRNILSSQLGSNKKMSVHTMKQISNTEDSLLETSNDNGRNEFLRFNLQILDHNRKTFLGSTDYVHVNK